MSVPTAPQYGGSLGADAAAFSGRGLVGFVRALRAGGAQVGTAALLDADAALAAVGPERRSDIRAALRATLVRSASDLDLFELLFESFYPRVAASSAGGKVLAQTPADAAAPAAGRRLADGLASQQDLRSVEAVRRRVTHEGGAQSTLERLKNKDFEQMSATELAAAKALVPELARTQARRRARGSQACGAAVRIDLRAMLRRRDLETLRYQWPRSEPRDCVLLVDISGSMSLYSRLFLHLAHALSRCPGRIETFVFATRLSHITRALKIAEPDRAIAAASRAASDWDGGTRLGACLAEFNLKWSRRVLAGGARVILLSDGLERDAAEQLEPQVIRLSRAAHQLLWINPLLRSGSYAPLAAGAQVLARHADALRPAHNIAALAALVRLLN
jgi:uncharacterized protein with von Willebrand factor type A (vWA) domain